MAAEDNAEGVVGVAPEASLYAVKALDSSGSGYLSDVVAGVDWAVDNDMDVISMSLGSDFYSSTLETACDNAYQNGLILVAAAGNDGNPAGKTDSVDYPARYDSVIAVAATDDTDTRATWSSTGPDVELSAPGVSIYSTYLNDGYATGSGTSMACPHVAGTVALAKIAYPTYSNIEIRSLLQNTADDLGAAGFDIKYGHGLVDADEAAPNTIPDTVQPSTITDLTVTAGAYPSIELTWSAATDDVGVVGYKIYRSIVGTIDKITDYLDSTIGISYTDLTGTTGTTYYYAVCAYDAAGNEAKLSNVVSATVAEAPINTMHVASIDMTTKVKGINTTAIATVTIVDADGNPVEGVTVYGHWSELTSDSDIGVTDASGQISLTSDRVKRASGTFTFTVDDVALGGWTYDPTANVDTSDSITVQ